MHPIRPFSIIVLLFSILSGCIESYSPKEIGDNYSYVVSGQVTNVSGFHYVRVSMTSAITKPRFIPVADCIVEIFDSDNNLFSSNSNGLDGEYSVWIDQQYLESGKAFKLVVTTPDYIVIESEYDTLKPCPDIAPLQYSLVEKPTSNPNTFVKGIQFKVDLIADNQYDRFFRWEMEETYEYRATYPISIYYDGELDTILPPDYSRFYCWATNPIRNIYTLSTKGLVENKFIGYNLHFVDNHSQKLMYLYSLKLTQYSLTENFYNYWEQLRANSSEQGGMFDTQPITINGNLSSPTNPNIRVLGYFGASSTKTERLFFSNFENLDFDLPDFCTPEPLLLGFSPFAPEDYPVYVVVVNGSLRWANKQCFDCTENGGTTEKPLFWP